MKRKSSAEKVVSSHVFNLRGLADYQEGAIVSREIVKKTAGSITIFSFDKDQGLSEHTAPYDALVYLLDGEAEIVISGKSHHLKAGDMIVMPGGKPHALRAVDRFKMMLVMIKS